ncbi:hypothetical protein [Pendulispora albinea]|uniref:Tryptophan synthase alpha chain n=1 Tax=Pendulispora albinea TaxID=2741071 RepID=A0ABZ2LZ17_9BACT
MNTTRLAVALGVALLATGASFIACSGDDATLPPGDDASTDGTTGRDSGPGPRDSGSGGRDAGPDTSSPYDPGQVSCGTTRCNVPAQVCCLPGNNPDAGAACENPPACQAPRRVACDETNDCAQDAGAMICCNQPVNGGGGGGGRVNSSCSTVRGCLQALVPGRIACKTDSDCVLEDGGVDAGHCVVQTCKGHIFRSCGGLPANDAGSVCN